jgi:hypothetical protein
MNDEGSNQSTGAVLTGAFRSSVNPLELKFRTIPDVSSLRFTISLEQVARLLLMALLLVLLVPAMLTLAVLAIVVARGLGVPLCAPSLPGSVMTKRS